MAWILSGDPRLGPLAGGPAAPQGPLAGVPQEPVGMVGGRMSPELLAALNAESGTAMTNPNTLGQANAVLPSNAWVRSMMGGPPVPDTPEWVTGLGNASNYGMLAGGPMVGAFTGPAKWETQVGYHLKDVNRGGLIGQDRAVQRAMNRAVDQKDWVETELPLRSINGTQLKVNPDYADVPSKNPALPLVIKVGGQYYARDGHHRLVAAAAAGKQTAKVRLIDIDQTSDPSTPLLDWSPGQQQRPGT